MSRIHTFGLACALLVSAILPMTAAAAPGKSWDTGAVYTATNAPNGNAVIAFHRAADGTLSYLHTFPTGGRGSGGSVDPLQSQHSLLLNGSHRLLFAVNSGSGDVSVFSVLPSGWLTLLSVTPSGGGFPVGLALHENILAVLNAGGAGNVSAFIVRRTGHLFPISGASHLLSGASAGGSSVDFSADGHTLAVTERLTNLIDTFAISSEGIAGLVLTPSSGKVPFALTVTSAGVLLAVEAGGNPAGGSAVSSYAIQSDSTLQIISPSVPTNFSGACWIVATHDGQYAYTSNTTNSEISTLSIGSDGSLTVLGAASSGAGTVPLDLTLSRGDHYLYALTAGAGTITGFHLEADGSLTEVGTVAAQPAASGQNGLVAY